MWNTSRDLRETVIRAMAKVGLVWAVAVLGALFMATAAQGQQHDDRAALSSAGAGTHSAAASDTPGNAPRTAGLAVALVILGGGVTVLALGASRGDRVAQHSSSADPEPVSDPGQDLPLALGFALLA